MWGGALALCLLWALAVEAMVARMPLARRAVTNVAEVEQVVPAPAVLPQSVASTRAGRAWSPSRPKRR